jgi:thiamine-monophosphate kinase
VQVREFGEDALIRAFAEIYRAGAGVAIGIGDDGAVVTSDDPHLVMTTDIATDGIHFNRDWSSPRDIGAKIAIANLADVFAMGATPRYLTVAMAIPGDEEVSYLLEIARGIEEISQAHGVSVVGGDVSAGARLMIAITALGGVDSSVQRSGAKVGDALFITAGAGKALAGLLLLSKGLSSIDATDVRVFQRPEFHPEDLQKFGFSKVNALMDVSDGLLTDLPKIARASGVNIDLDIPESKLGYLKELAERLGLSPLELFLRSGEEHSFIVSISPEWLSEVPAQWISIGVVRSGEGVTFRGGKLPVTGDSWHW